MAERKNFLGGNKGSEFISSKPFYLKEGKMSRITAVSLGLMFIVIGIANPFLLLFTPIILFFGVKHIKNLKSEENIALGKAIEYYNKAEFEKCEIELYRVLQHEKSSVRGNILLALIRYENENFEEVIHLLKLIPSRIIDNELDLKMKLAEAYKRTAKYAEAKGIYKELLKINPNSKYVKKAIEECDKQC